MTLKLAQFCDDPPKKISTKSSYPPKNIHFSEPPKNIEIQILNPKKYPKPTYVWKYQSTSPRAHIVHVQARKSVFGVSDQVRLQLGYSWGTETS